MAQSFKAVFSVHHRDANLIVLRLLDAVLFLRWC